MPGGSRNKRTHLKNGCVSCGSCLSVCPVYRAGFLERLSPRGKYLLLEADGRELLGQKAQSDSLVLETISACLQCGACASVCAAGVDVQALIRQRRKELEGRGLLTLSGAESRMQKKGLELLDRGPAAGTGLALKLAGRLLSGVSGVSLPLERLSLESPFLKEALEQDRNGLEPASDSGDLKAGFFVGCVQNYLLKDAAEGCLELLKNAAGARVSLPQDQGCCGLAAYSSGFEKLAVKQAERNIDALSAGGYDLIVTGCASCAYMLRSYSKVVPKGSSLEKKAKEMAGKVVELSGLLALFLRRLPEGFSPERAPVTTDRPAVFQLPCHQHYGLGSAGDMDLLTERLGLGFSAQIGCCGFGGSFFMKQRGLSSRIRKDAVEEAKRAGAEIVVTTCSGCLLNWELAREAGSGLVPMHLSKYLSVHELCSILENGRLKGMKETDGS